MSPPLGAREARGGRPDLGLAPQADQRSPLSGAVNGRSLLAEKVPGSSSDVLRHNLHAEPASNLLDQLIPNGLARFSREIWAEENNAGEALGWIMSQEIANTVEAGLGQRMGPALSRFVGWSRMDFRSDPPGSR